MNLPVEEPFGEGSAKESQEAIHRRAASRKLLDEVFGDVLPTLTRDERDEGAGRPRQTDGDQWYRDNRPPHHQ